jgi:RNA polymerase sigma-19 factor, ECF subfamily
MPKDNKYFLSDTRNFERIFKEFFNPLAYYARIFTKDQDSAKDIVHNVFINLWEKRDDISFEQSIKSYLYTSVHNRCLNHLRDRAKFIKDDVSEFEFLNSQSVEDSYDIETKETESRINDAINSLPERCREVFKLKRFEELKYSEIADLLNISIKTVEAQMSKALRILREELKDYLILLLWLTIKIFW